VIWLLRHGDASDDAPDDTSRELTRKGRAQAAATGRALARLDVRLEACITSPKVRARDTAVIVCEELGLEPELDESLRGGDFDPAGVAAGRGEVLLVGHEPDLSRAVAATTGARVKLKKGGLAGINGSVLVALMRPSELAAIADG
jgi:phosphohistidine phosphatase